jgi:hypothetical protein
MPEPYWPKHKHSFFLSDAERNGSIAHMRCRYCKFERFVRLADLRALLGDIECDHVTDHHRWRCSNCKKTQTMTIDVVTPSAADRQRVIFRRLVRIDYIARPVWQDE